MDDDYTTGCGGAFGDAQNKGGCVLIADDTKMALVSLRNQLQSQAGIPDNQILVADDGDAAWELFLKNKDKIRAVVTDQNMPGLNGIDVIERINEYSSQPPLMILHSSIFNNNELVQCKDADVVARAGAARAVGVPKNGFKAEHWFMILDAVNNKREAPEHQVPPQLMTLSGI